MSFFIITIRIILSRSEVIRLMNRGSAANGLACGFNERKGEKMGGEESFYIHQHKLQIRWSVQEQHRRIKAICSAMRLLPVYVSV